MSIFSARSLLIAFMFPLSACLGGDLVALHRDDPKLTPEPVPDSTEIFWDNYGVPTIYGASDPAMYYGFGRAQAEAHGELILTLYVQARGRAAEYLGPEYLDSDIFMHQMDVPRRGERWAAQQDREFLKNLDAFAMGVNDYVEDHPEKISEPLRSVLPITSADLLSHMNAVLNVSFVGGYQGGPASVAANWQKPPGSNMWMLGPSRTESGAPILLVNPHLSWSGFQLFFEAGLNSPSVQGHGITLVGFPVLVTAFNGHLGWAHTVNKMDGADYYELTLEDNGYLLDGHVLPFETRDETLKIRREDGGHDTQTITIMRSAHGHVISKKDGNALSLRLAGIDEAFAAEQYHQMLQATSFEAFEAAIRRLQIPTFHIGYADREGNIFFLFGGRNPRKRDGDWEDWKKVLPGDRSDNIWNETLAYEALPKLFNPAQGWIQNANDPPWWSTVPTELHRADYPAWLSSTQLDLRPQSSLQLIQSKDIWTVEDVIDAKFSSRMIMADRVLDDLIALAASSNDPVIRDAAVVLSEWDREARQESRGTALFVEWFDQVGGADLYEQPWTLAEPYDTPRGLAAKNANSADVLPELTALKRAAENLIAKHGSADVPWGEVHRFRIGETSWPADGADGDFGAFRQIVSTSLDENGERVAFAGDTYVGIWEFEETGVEAHGVLGYGNSSQAGSPHQTDQIEMFTRHEMRSVRLDSDSVKARSERYERFQPEFDN